MPRFREREVSSKDEQKLDDGYLAMYEPGVLSRKIPPRHWDRGRGVTWPVSDEALRIWATRVGLDAELVVAHERERFRDGPRKSPPGLVWADPEACARGTYQTPRELQHEDGRQSRVRRYHSTVR